MIVWSPRAVDDLHRLWQFKLAHNDEAKADAPIDELISAGDALKRTSRSSGPAPWCRKKFVREYVISFSHVRPDIEVSGVFSCREDWQGRVLMR